MNASHPRIVGLQRLEGSHILNFNTMMHQQIIELIYQARKLKMPYLHFFCKLNNLSPSLHFYSII